MPRLRGVSAIAVLSPLMLAVVLSMPASAQLAGKTIRIGVGTPLTTGSATFGIEMRQAVDLAIAERNAAGGVLGAMIAAEIADDTADNAKGEVVAKGFCEAPEILG